MKGKKEEYRMILNLSVFPRFKRASIALEYIYICCSLWTRMFFFTAENCMKDTVSRLANIPAEIIDINSENELILHP
jgi:hypothetical protein